MTDKDDFEETLADYVRSNEPLADKACGFVVDYKQETIYLDYKESFNPNEQRDWLNITRDIVAFANTLGGYLVFGIRDKTFEHIGLEQKDWQELVDPDSVHKRINAYIYPPLTSLTSRHKEIGGKHFLILHIPQSPGRTHIVTREGKYRDKKGDEVIRLRKGEIYVRRSASTHLIEPIDLDEIINRRIDFYKDTLLSKIAKIVEAPTEREVVIITTGQEEIAAGDRRYILSNDPSAIPVRGLGLTEPPLSDDSEISTSIALFKKDRNHKPSRKLLYRIYGKRKTVALSNTLIVDLVLISILEDVPCYYWLQSLRREDIESILNEVFEIGNFFHRATALRIAYCVGKSHFTKYYKKGNDMRFEQLKKKVEQQGIEGLYFDYDTKRLPPEQLEEEAITLVNKILGDLNTRMREDISDKDQLWTVDFRLYAGNISSLK